MKKWITPLTKKTFIFSTSVYLLLLLILFLSPVRADSVFGRAINILVYIAPIVIIGEAVVGILKERTRLAKHAEKDDAHS